MPVSKCPRVLQKALRYGNIVVAQLLPAPELESQRAAQIIRVLMAEHAYVLQDPKVPEKGRRALTSRGICISRDEEQKPLRLEQPTNLAQYLERVFQMLKHIRKHDRVERRGLRFQLRSG